jgi:hypothetical protein
MCNVLSQTHFIIQRWKVGSEFRISRISRFAKRGEQRRIAVKLLSFALWFVDAIALTIEPMQIRNRLHSRSRRLRDSPRRANEFIL